MGKIIFWAFLILGAFDLALADSSLVLENDTNHVLISGTFTVVYGCRGENNLTLESGAKAELFHFVDANTVTVRAGSDLFSVSRSGSTVTFAGTDGTMLVMPATTVPQTIAFDDGALQLVIDSGRVMLGNQEVGTVPKGFSTLVWTLSGTVTAPDHAAVDTDVNDIIGKAQSLFKPVIAGGYVNRPGAGERGRAHTAGNENDCYRFSLFGALV